MTKKPKPIDYGTQQDYWAQQEEYSKIRLSPEGSDIPSPGIVVTENITSDGWRVQMVTDGNGGHYVRKVPVKP